MKTLSICAVLLFSLFNTNHSFAQKTDALNKKEQIKVWGNCESCKKRIENAAKAAGAISANWNEDSKILAVSYDNAKTSSLQIQQKIADKGYDTQDIIASDAAYNKLPGCCQYERKDSVVADGKKCCDNVKCHKEADACKGMTCCKEKTCCKM